MSHVYQPVMLMTLLNNGGQAITRMTAQTILAHDESQIEYYEQITRRMVGRVSQSHQIVGREGEMYHLLGFSVLTPQQIADLVQFCGAKLAAYIQRRGERIWHHPRKSAGYVSGTLRYEVLKQAKFRCEMCGIAADEKALEVDHIIPRNQGGTDDLPNLQALCYSCNAMKRARDETDFRTVRQSYEDRADECVFCHMPDDHMLQQNRLAYAVRDHSPVSPLHTLIIPKRHEVSYFALGRPEAHACHQLLAEMKDEVLHLDHTVTGFNSGSTRGRQPVRPSRIATCTSFRGGQGM